MLTEMLSDVVARRRLRASASQITSACKTARAKRIEFEETIVGFNSQTGSGALATGALAIDDWGDFGVDADAELEMVSPWLLAPLLLFHLSLSIYLPTYLSINFRARPCGCRKSCTQLRMQAAVAAF